MIWKYAYFFDILKWREKKSDLLDLTVIIIGNVRDSYLDSFTKRV